MKRVTVPQVYLIASTTLHSVEVERYLTDIGTNFVCPETNDYDLLVELAGRVCYRSWEPHDTSKPEATNPNISTVRTDPRAYIANILGIDREGPGHGSVLEHVSFTFLVRDCSRVFTHELVRHRAGMAYSQESLRFVRLSELRFWLPPEAEQYREFLESKVSELEVLQRELEDLFGVDKVKGLAKKKELTSLMRRLAPIGLATTIVFTANARALRHIIWMRTRPEAEVEIRRVFDRVATICKEKAPGIFQDMDRDSDGAWTFRKTKV